jgi:hypothetical protein
MAGETTSRRQDEDKAVLVCHRVNMPMEWYRWCSTASGTSTVWYPKTCNSGKFCPFRIFITFCDVVTKINKQDSVFEFDTFSYRRIELEVKVN